MKLIRTGNKFPRLITWDDEMGYAISCRPEFIPVGDSIAWNMHRAPQAGIYSRYTPLHMKTKLQPLYGGINSPAAEWIESNKLNTEDDTCPVICCGSGE